LPFDIAASEPFRKARTLSAEYGARCAPFTKPYLALASDFEKDFVSYTSCLGGMAMELRHFRYFIAVADEGSITVAAKRRLHTAQPSLSRQIRDLEYEVGVPLLTRSVHGALGSLPQAARFSIMHALRSPKRKRPQKRRAAPRRLPSRFSQWASSRGKKPNGSRAPPTFCAANCRI
jgi:Bacterial regulatory helix-turn-helix protein, lysR family